jgi:hypothetical protein
MLIDRICGTCKVLKNISKFHRNKSRSSGYCFECKVCLNTRKRKRTSLKLNKIQSKETEMIHSSKGRAKKKNIEHSITISDIFIPDMCPVLSIPLVKNSNIICDGSPTLDRIDPNIGYVKTNIMVISHKANRIKNNATVGEIFKVAEFLRKYHQQYNK